MKLTVFIVTILNLSFFVYHRIDVISHSGWGMVSVLKNFSEPLKKQIFLYLHIPLPSILIGYLYLVFALCYYELFILFNLFAVAHLILYLRITKKHTDVTKHPSSLVIIVGFAITGLINLILTAQIIC